MTTPVKQRTCFTPIGSNRKGTANHVANYANAEHMTPSRMNRTFPPKPQEKVEQNSSDGEGIQGTTL